ncbi:MAG: hypothetical protein OXC91_03280, partial [Rhodobacteraceae bacterium]|nr:hypothetical protein [Paracoccaceae bacterium]
LTLRGQGRGPWDAVVDALYPLSEGQSVGVDWDESLDVDKWTATEGNVSMAPAGRHREHENIGTWKRVS